MPSSQHIHALVSVALLFCAASTAKSDELCSNGLYSNGPYDSFGGISSCFQISSPYDYDAAVADTATFDESAVLEEFIWWTAETKSAHWTGNVNIAVYLPDGPDGAPGTVAYSQTDVPAYRFDQGVHIFESYELVQYEVEGLSIPVDAGKVLISLQVVLKEGDAAAVYWLTAPDSGDPYWWRRTHSDEENWTKDVFYGADENMSFCVIGRRAGPCDDADITYANGAYDKYTYSPSFRGLGTNHDAWTADDMSPARATAVSAFHWYMMETNEYQPTGRADILVALPDGPNGAPGTVAYELFDLNINRTPALDYMFGAPIVLYSTTGLPAGFNLTDSSYFVGLRAVGYHGGVSCCVSAPVTDLPIYYKDEFLGVPDWTLWIDKYPFAPPRNFSFCMSGAALPLGACCFNDGVCAFISENDCVNGGGDYSSDGVRCIDRQCTAVGACCTSDGSCHVVTQGKCEKAGGKYFGDDTQCDDHTCDTPVGACCKSDNSCGIATQSKCEFVGGRYLGDHTTCSPNPCSNGSSGGCCFRDGSCERTSKSKCNNAGGNYLGDGTACDPNPCPQPNGACCFGETCQRLTSAKCNDRGGEYAGNNTSCAADRCAVPRGACCLGVTCFAGGTSDNCTTSGGVYRGDNTGCELTPCTPTAGACCLADNSCALYYPDDCALQGGTFQGADTNCNNIDCKCPGIVRGDSNCSGGVDFDDINCFVAALVSESTWDACGHAVNCDYICANDIDRNGHVDFEDIDGFVICIINGGCP